LGPDIGINTTTASVSGLIPVTFTAGGIGCRGMIFIFTPLMNCDAFVVPPAVINLDDGVNLKVAQKLTAFGAAVGKVKIRASLSGPGAFGGDRISVSLQTDDGGKPSGILLANSEGVPQLGGGGKGGFMQIGTNQSAAEIAWSTDGVNATGDWNGVLREDVVYWIVFERQSPTSSAHYFLGSDNSNPYGDGQVAVFDGTTWNTTTFAGHDLMMGLIGGLPPANRPPTAVACIVPTEFLTSLDPVDPGPTDCIKVAESVGGPIPRPVTLNGTGSTGEFVEWRWSEGGRTLASCLRCGEPPRIDVLLDAGQHTITLTVSDGELHSTDQIRISVLREVIVLVHGYNSSTSDAFDLMPQLLEGSGYSVVSFDYSADTRICSDLGPDPKLIQDIAHDFALAIKGEGPTPLLPDGRRITASRPTHIVAHSMGGLVARAYISGMAGLPYDEAFASLILVGTPNYGATLAAFSPLCRFKSGKVIETQEIQQIHGSRFLWELHDRWRMPPIARDRVLGIVGSLTRTEGRQCSKFAGRSDGLVTVVSAVLPIEAMQHVVYLPYKHGSGSYLRLDECLTPRVAAAQNNQHETYKAIVRFLERSDVLVPGLDPRPPEVRQQALVLVKIEDELGNQFEDPNLLRYTLTAADGSSYRCGVEPLWCDGSVEAGTMSIFWVPVVGSPGSAARFTLDVSGNGWRLLDFERPEITVTQGRPTGVLVRLCRSRGCRA
jgi:pimeloyl-ACP methyl ester carboxylesterase